MIHAERFAHLTELLRRHERYWRPSPFVYPTPAWCESEPALMDACVQLPDGFPAELEADPQTLQRWLESYLPELVVLTELLQVPSPVRDVPAMPSHWAVDIPGRKWEQIASFVALTPHHHGSLVDWCSGKSHLGRTVAQLRHRPVIAIERDAVLCSEGAALAKHAKVSAQFVCADVLKASIDLPATAQVLALHACGDLHRTLLRRIQQQPVAGVVLAPCCYHLWLQDQYVPLSNKGQASNLQLDRNSVQLAVQEAVTSSTCIRSRSATLAAWRLGFDSLQRELRSKDEYMTTPSLPQSVLQDGFEAVCRRIAAHKKLVLPEGIDWRHYQDLGESRLLRAQKLQVVRHGFRRAIELWLVLDLALFLEESGYQVSLQLFCPRELTPRNLLLCAQRK